MHLNPSALLELEADDALAAAKTVLHEMRQNLREAADPRKLTSEHPWASVGAAAVAGFVGAMMVVPSKEDAALKRLERIEAALGAGAGADGHARESAGAAKGRRSTIWRLMARQGFNMIKPMLLATLTGTLSAKATASSAQYDAEESGEDGSTVTAYETDTEA